MMNAETICYEMKKAVARITLNRPETYHAFTPKMLQEITAAVKKADEDDSVRCIVLTGSGKAFSAGQDIKSIDAKMDYAQLLKENYHPMFWAITGATKPVIVAVNGVAAGAGMSLALAADFRIVKQETKFISAFMGIGLVPDCGFMYILPRLVGYAKALEIAAIGKPITGEDAVELGLATEIYEGKDWGQQVAAFAENVASLPTKAFAQMKCSMMAGMHADMELTLELEAQAQQIAGMTHDHQEGIQAFKEKRPSQFIGK